MKKYINKSTLDDLIRVYRKYWKKGDTDLLSKITNLSEELINQLGLEKYKWFVFADIISATARLNASNEQIYQIFDILNIDIREEKNNDN